MENKKYKKEEIANFNPDEWKFEISSGYSGCRNKRTDEWIYESEFLSKCSVKQSYENNFKLISDFRLSQLPFGKYPDYHIIEFLDKKYFL